jgi:predicted metal-dependent enzyme (double-stranded beta helix superfamily)
MDKVGQLLVGLAGQEDYVAPLVAAMPAQETGGSWLSAPDLGPRLLLFHRPEGVMACTHSHRCWVVLAPVQGVETHQRWSTVRHDDGRAEMRLIEDRRLQRGDVVAMVPPNDVHNHGHVPGSGPAPYSLILTGDDMFAHQREEYDLKQGTWRNLAPGDRGCLNR